MLRAILATGVLLSVLSACTQPLPFKYCETDAECQNDPSGSGYCDLTGDPPSHKCVAPSETQGCTPGCFSYQVCARNSDSVSCVARYTLELTPADGTVVGAGPVTVTATLKVGPGFNATYPDHLNFTAVASDGSEAGTFSAPMVDGGVYTSNWTPPSREGTYQLRVSYPEQGGPSATAGLTVNLPPSLALLPTAASPAATDGGFVYADPQAPTAWRRDQTVSVRIESDSTDLDTSTLSVVVHGVDGGTDVTGLPVTAVSACSRAYCGNVDVPLWKPGLPAFRGDFKIDVTAKDKGGLQGTATNTIPVTRWKWSFNGGVGAPSSPAIGQMGTVYFGTSDSKGKVFALAPEGKEKWENQLGTVKGSPAVGAYNTSTGLERVYIGVTGQGSNASFLYALGANGIPTNQCQSGTVLTAVAVLNTLEYGEGSSAFETAVALDDNNSLIALRAGASGSKVCLPNNASTSAVLPGASVLAKGGDVYFPDNDAKVQELTFNGGGALSNAGWGTKSGYTAPQLNAPILGMGFSSSGQVVGAAGVNTPKTGGVFALSAANGTVAWKNPTSFDDSPVRNMSIGSGDVLFYGREVSGGDLTVIGIPPGTAKTTVPGVGSIVGAPILGASNIFYTASSASVSATGVGEVTAWNEGSFTPLWKLSDSVGLVQASPSIDCARNSDGSIMAATYGVLYVPSTNGSLYAFFVDSPGLDTTAPWPKYQHDVRNTGNPDTTITACPVPSP